MTTNPDDAVRLIQTGLQKLGHSHGAIDGRWGGQTARALRQLIAANGRSASLAPQGHLPWITERERLELVREAWAEAREEGQGHVSAGLAALRAVAGRQAKELNPDELKERLARIAGRDLGADGPGHEAGADVIRDRLKQVLWRDKPDPRIEQQRKLEEDREKQRQLELERQRERDRDLDWKL